MMNKIDNISINTSNVKIDKKKRMLAQPIFSITYDLYNDENELIHNVLNTISLYKNNKIDKIVFVDDNLSIIDLSKVNDNILYKLYTYFTKNKILLSDILNKQINEKLRSYKIKTLE